MSSNLLVILLLSCCFILQLTFAADRSNFKKCEESGFCTRNRALNSDDNRWTIPPESIQTLSDSVLFHLKNVETGISLQASLESLISGQSFRFRVDEINSEKKRFDAEQFVLLPNLKKTKLSVVDQSNNGFTIEVLDDVSKQKNKIVVTASPFRLNVYSGDDLVIVGNQRSLFNFEHYRHKTDDKNCHGCWEETFKGSTDSKPNGPMSVGMDFTLIGFEHVYGIPSHADNFALKNTKGSSDPYRLYNVDIFEYETYTPMSLYGAVPLMIAHSIKPKTVGLFWLNPSETWIDVESTNSGITGLLSGLVSDQKPNKLTHWISESGVVDVFFLLGPSISDVMKQNAKLTGTTQLPPIYSLGHHQSRWNYFSTEEVMDVDNKADIYDIPLDSIWLDIEYTQGRSKKYFTWDPVTFRDHQSMITNLTSKGRRLIAIIDPHLKKESGYSVFDEATANGYLTKDSKEDKDFEGWCWPGSSAWADFLNPVVREWWGQKFDPKFFPGFEGGIVDIWNDMNEPSVFSGPEITAPRDMRHIDGIEHREVHNLYGYFMTKSTYDGLVKYRPNIRPFILSRSYYAGSQRNVAIWTGDNMCKWDHLKISIAMLLSNSIVGMSFVGADIPGFFFNPESEEIVVRWYQASIFHPFFRAHAHLDTKRREPWTFSDYTRDYIREILRIRYNYMPYMYQLFHQNEQDGMPPMRPLWYQFPSDKKTLDIDTSYMLGSDILVAPVLDKEAKTVDIYLPSNVEGTTTWMDVFTHKIFQGAMDYRFEVDITSLPIFQRSGSIVPKRERPRRAAFLAVNDPLTLQIYLDSSSSAKGFIYLDDGISFDYKTKKAFISGSLDLSKRVLTYTFENGDPESNKAWLERVVIYGYNTKPNHITAHVNNGGIETKTQLAFKFDKVKNVLIIRKPTLSFGQSWQIKIL